MRLREGRKVLWDALVWQRRPGNRKRKVHKSQARISFERENMFLTGMSGWEKSWGLLPLQPHKHHSKTSFLYLVSNCRPNSYPSSLAGSWGLSCLVAGTAAPGGVYQAAHWEGTGSLIVPPEICELGSSGPGGHPRGLLRKGKGEQ